MVDIIKPTKEASEGGRADGYEAGAAEFDRLFELARKKHEQESLGESWSFKLGKALRKFFGIVKKP